MISFHFTYFLFSSTGAAQLLPIFVRSFYLVRCRHSLVKQLEGSELDGPSPLRRTSHSSSDHYHQHHLHNQIQLPRVYRRASLDDLEQESCLLAPTVENRIVKLTPEVGWRFLFHFIRTLQFQKERNIIVFMSQLISLQFFLFSSSRWFFRSNQYLNVESYKKTCCFKHTYLFETNVWKLKHCFFWSGSLKHSFKRLPIDSAAFCRPSSALYFTSELYLRYWNTDEFPHFFVE